MVRLLGDRFVGVGKVAEYLLNPEHPFGASKARFFERFGFVAAVPETLLSALSAHPDTNEVIAVETGRYGIKSVIRCALVTPDGRNPCITTVWMLDAGAAVHRFVTACPAT